jgi:dTDP-4-dehydrorhamnose reductase
MQRLLITGASGQLGAYLLQTAAAEFGTRFRVTAWCNSRAGELLRTELKQVPLTDAAAVRSAWEQARPDVVIHAAAISGVQDCFRQPQRARQVNTLASAHLADLAGVDQRHLVYVSTDMVFDGETGNYVEDDEASPLSHYGRTKLDGESEVLAHSNVAVARVSLLYGPSLSGRPTFFDQQCATLREGRPLTLFNDEWRTPLDLLTAARGLLELAASSYCGRLHLAGSQRFSRWEMGRRLAAALGINDQSLVAGSRCDAPASEPRPRDLSLQIGAWRRSFPQVVRPDFDEATAALQENLKNIRRPP